MSPSIIVMRMYCPVIVWVLSIIGLKRLRHRRQHINIAPSGYLVISYTNLKLGIFSPSDLRVILSDLAIRGNCRNKLPCFIKTITLHKKSIRNTLRINREVDQLLSGFNTLCAPAAPWFLACPTTTS